MKTAIFVCLALSAFAQTSAPVSDKFPVAIHVTNVRMEQSNDTRTSHTGRVFGGSYIWNVMTCEINGRMYGLKGHRLELGWYAGRESKDGFEIQFQNGKKIVTKHYRVVEEH